MESIIQRFTNWWSSLTGNQRTIMVAGAIISTILIASTAYFASRPKMMTLYSNLNAADQGVVVSELQKIGIDVEYDTSGNVRVASDKMAESRMRLSMGGKTPSSGHSGNADLEKLGMLNTPKVEQERLKIALEGELGKSVESLNAVQSARVHLNLGDNSPFLNERKPASASINITENSITSISSEEARAVAQMVANAVPGLDMRRITIVNTRGRMLWDGSNEDGIEGVAQRKKQAELEEAKRREKEVQRVLDVAYGKGNTVATVNLTMDFDKKYEELVEKIPTEEPVMRESNEETMIEQDGSGNPVGVNPNVPAAGQPAAPQARGSGGMQNYKGKQVAETYGGNEKRSKIESALGNVTSMSINVIVDDGKVKDLDRVRSFLSGYLGPLDGDPRFTATVTSVPFDRTAQAEAQEAAAQADQRERIQQIISLLPILALVLVGFMIARTINKAAKERREQELLLEQQRQQAALEAAEREEAERLAAAERAALEYGGDGMPMNMDMDDLPFDDDFDDGDEAAKAQREARARAAVRAMMNLPENVANELEEIALVAKERPDAFAMVIKTIMSE